MSLVINHNLMAMNAARDLNNAYSSLGVSTRRLSSGLRGTEAGGAANTQQASAQEQGAAGQTSGESLAAGSAEQAKGALVNSSDSGAGSGQNAAGQGALSAMLQADTVPQIPQGIDAPPTMNITPTATDQAVDPNMSDTGQNALQGMSRLQAMSQNGLAALARSSQNVGALLNTSDSNALQALNTGSSLSHDQMMRSLASPAQYANIQAGAEMDNSLARMNNQLRVMSETTDMKLNAIAHQNQMVMDLFKTSG